MTCTLEHPLEGHKPYWRRNRGLTYALPFTVCGKCGRVVESEVDSTYSPMNNPER